MRSTFKALHLIKTHICVFLPVILEPSFISFHHLQYTPSLSLFDSRSLYDAHWLSPPPCPLSPPSLSPGQ